MSQQRAYPLAGALGEAVNAARYNFQEKNRNGEKAVEAVNPAQNLRASFTPEDVQIQASSACQTPWQLGLKLKRVAYGTEGHEVRPGKVSAQGNRVEIYHSLQAANLESHITAWYLNKPEGLEQGFTLQARPDTAPSGELRVVMEFSQGWKATTDRDQQALTLQQGAATLRYNKLHTIDATGRALPSRMEVSGDELALVVNDADAVWPITIDPTLTQQTQFVAANGAAYDHFGAAVAISGDTAVVGVPDFDASGATNAGTVFVFVRADSAWSQQAQLTASDAASHDGFGAAVAISGDTIVVGAYGDDNGFNSDQGAAYVFVRNATTWSQQAKLTASQSAANDWFGYSVAISGDTAIIGAPLDDFGSTVNQGSAYVFTRSGATWSQQQQLNATDAADSDNFGFTVALQNETAVVGAPADDVNGNSDQGSAYVFVRNSTAWSQQQQLNPSDGSSGDLFGFAVALSGETVIVGAPQDDVNGNVNQGSAHVFTRSNATWSPQTRLTANDGAGGDTFGHSVALSGEMAVIGAPTNDVGGNSDQGSAYVFVRDNATWTQQQQMFASDGASNDSAGQAVAISGFTALIGAPNDDVNGNNDQGSTYVFSPTCPTMTLSPATLPSGTQNLTYPTTTISSGAGTMPLTYALIAGALPAGLTFSASGELSGTPTAAGNFNFTVKVTDANLCTGRQSYALAIATCAPPVVTTPPTNQSSAVGSSASFTAASSGTPPSVQWQVSTDGNSWSNIEGATNVTLNLANLAITMHGNRYRAVFTNACGTATSDPATLTVNQLTSAVTLNSSATSVTYGQGVTLTANVSSINAVAPTGTITFKDGSATLGTGTINNGQATLSLNSLNAAVHSFTAEYSGDQNYLGGSTSARELTVNKAILTVTAENKTKSYGGANPALTATITGFVSEETASVVTGAADLSTTATTGSSVGEYPITAARGTLAAANYDFTFVPAKLTVGQASLTITADAKSRTYGAANPALTATITGFVNGETESALSGTLQLSTTATVSSAVGEYPISVSGYTSTNYAITYVASTLTISKSVLNVTAEHKTKTYGAANPELTATITGFVNGDTESALSGTLQLSTTATTSSTVGEYPISVSGYTSTNYAINYVAGTLTISKALLTVTAENKRKLYGAANPALTATITGFVNGETESALSGTLQLSTTATASSAVGEYPISASGYTSTNYALNYVAGALTISKAVLTVTAENKTKLYGAANPELTATITGFVNNETTSAISGAPALTTTATQTSGAGNYPINAALGTLSATNYDFTFANGTLTIGKATLTVTAANKIKVFGAPVPELTYNITGFLNSDNASAVSGAPSLTTTATDTSNVGTYPISIARGTLTAESYEFNFVAAELTISPAATAVVLVSNLPMSLFGQAVTFTANVAAVAPGAGTPTGTITFKDGATVLGTSALANGQAALTTSALATGAHHITAEYSGADNFTASASQVVTHTVSKAAATVTLASSFEAVRYGQAVTLNATVSGNEVTGNVRFLNGNVTLGTVALTNGAASLTTNALPIGTHTITAVYDGDTKNDGGTSRNLTLTVNKALPVLQISSSANPAAWKQFVTLAASANSPESGLVAPSGTIVFKEGATVLGTSTLSRLGRASISTNSLAPGSHSITAEFIGDSYYEAVAATAISQTVGKGETAIRFSSSPQATTSGQSATFSALVYGYAGTPTGNVEIYDGAELLATVPLNNGFVTWSTTSLGDGERSIKAVYKGDEQFASSTSAALAHTVSPYCVWTPSTRNYWIGPNGGAGFIPVEGRSDCFWVAFTNFPWVTIYDYGPEVGAVSFGVSPLTTETGRKGTMNVAGLSITVLQAKPAVTVSGASYAREGLAPNTIASVFGEGLATETQPAQSLPLPTTLGGTQVKITDSKGVEHSAPLFYVSPLQINYLIPNEVALGTALVTVQTELGNIMGGGVIEITPVTPAIFTANSNGSGIAAADVQRALLDHSFRYEPVWQFDPVQNKAVPTPIDFGEVGEEVYLVLFGTGLRGRLALATVRATIANEDIEVLYAGAQGGFIGLDQINLKLPRTLAGKGEVELKLWVEGKLANTVLVYLK